MLASIGRNSNVTLVGYRTPVEGILFELKDDASMRALKSQLEYKAEVTSGNDETFEISNGDSRIYIQFTGAGIYVGARLR